MRLQTLVVLAFSLFFCGTPPVAHALSQEMERDSQIQGMEYQQYRGTQKGVTVDAHITRRNEKVLKIEFIADPPGSVQLKNAQLISPEGTIHTPQATYEVSEQAARNLGRLRPIPVVKTKKSKSSMGKIGSALLGAGLSTALSGMSSPSHSTAYHAGQYGREAAKASGSGTAALGALGGLAPLALSGGKSPKAQPGEEIQWIEPKTAGTGIFSSVAEFECPASESSGGPWQLKADMENPKGSPLTYTFILGSGLVTAGGGPPRPLQDSDWEDIQLTGPRSKLL